MNGGLFMKTVIQRELERQERSVHFLHKKIGGNRTNLYGVARGFSRGTVPVREKIAAFLGLSIEELFDESGMARKN